MYSTGYHNIGYMYRGNYAFVSSIELDATAVCCSWESFRLDSLVTQPLGTKNAPSLVETSTRVVAAHPLGD